MATKTKKMAKIAAKKTEETAPARRTAIVAKNIFGGRASSYRLTTVARMIVRLGVKAGKAQPFSAADIDEAIENDAQVAAYYKAGGPTIKAVGPYLASLSGQHTGNENVIAAHCGGAPLEKTGTGLFQLSKIGLRLVRESKSVK